MVCKLLILGRKQFHSDRLLGKRPRSSAAPAAPCPPVHLPVVRGSARTRSHPAPVSVRQAGTPRFPPALRPRPSANCAPARNAPPPRSHPAAPPDRKSTRL